MNLVSQLQRQYEWTPNYQLVSKKPVPQGLKTFRVPQLKGIPGWIIFTYENNIPVCIWVSKQECKKLVCIADERICGDTFLKVEKVGKLEFVVSDIWMYNSNCVFACSTFRQRYDWLSKFLSRFTHCIEGLTIDLIHKSDINDLPINGYEEYPEETVGKQGYFVPNDDSEVLQIIKLNIPDCYEIPGKGYLRVPNIETSRYLRTKGSTFTCRCKKYDDQFWDIVENILHTNVNGKTA